MQAPTVAACVHEYSGPVMPSGINSLLDYFVEFLNMI